MDGDKEDKVKGKLEGKVKGVKGKGDKEKEEIMKTEGKGVKEW